MKESKSNKQPIRRRLVVAGLIIAVVVVLFWQLPVAEWLVAAYDWVRSLGPWAMLGFVAIYTLLSMVGLPTSPLNVAAGLLFGLLWGFAASMVGVMAASVGCFLIARYLARGWVLKKVSCHPKFQAVLKGLKSESWQLILLTRLNPVLPAAVASYCFGVTPIGFRQYLAASFVGNVPLCFALAYLGSAGQLAFGRKDWTTTDYILYGLGFASTLALTVWLTRYTRRKFKQYEEGGERAEGEQSEASRKGSERPTPEGFATSEGAKV